MFANVVIHYKTSSRLNRLCKLKVIISVHILLIVLVTVVLGCGSSSSPAYNQSVVRPIEKKSDWSKIPDFDSLRTRYGERDDFSAVCEDNRPLSDAFEALDAGEWQRVVTLADGWLSQCKVDIDFHLLRAIALGELGRTDESKQQLRWRDGLVESVLRSGDGKTPETAWIVISVAEEYSILRAFGMRRKRQVLTSERRDMIEAERDGNLYILYFNPEAHFKRLDRLFGIAE